MFRRGVPAAYRKAFGKTEVRKTLNARNASDARVEILPHLREFEARLRRCKIASGNQSGETPSLQQIETAVREWFAARQERFERYEKSLKGEEERSHRLIELDEYELDARAAIRGDNSGAWTTNWIADEIITQRAWAVVEGTSEYLSLRRAVGRGQLEASRREREDLEGFAAATRRLAKPSRSSRSIRRQQGEGDKPTFSAISALDREASSCSNRRIRFSYASSGELSGPVIGTALPWRR